jgi:hypothetical protein
MPLVISVGGLMVLWLVLSKQKPITQKTDIELRHARKQNIAMFLVVLLAQFCFHPHGDWIEWMFRGLLVLVFLAVQYRYWQEFKKRNIDI